MPETVNNVEQEARGLGWVPLEEFRGDPSRWVDAEVFVERGHTVMPILKKTNERLDAQLRSQAEEIARLKERDQASQEAIDELKKVHQEATKAAVAKAKKDLLAELKIAKEEGNVDREVELTDALADLRESQREPATPPPAPSKAQPQASETMHPDYAAWVKENPWFGKDERKTLRAMGIAQELRAEPENDSLQGRPFFDKIMQVMDERTQGPRMSKVAEPRGDSRGAGGGTRTYADLPPDAKEACDRQGKKLVGEGRAFKDVGAWRSYYTNLFYQGEA